MKKIYTSLFFVPAFALLAQAQPTLTYSGIAPMVGDVFTTASSAYVPQGNGGANQTWNPGFTNSGTSSMTGVAPSSTPYSSSFPGSTVAFNSSGTYVYYKSTASAWQNMGYVTSAGTTLSYSDLEDMLHFPFNYNDTYTDSWYCTYIQSSYTYYRWGTTTVTADGWGTLTTPAGTFSNVMRVHFVQDYKDSTYIASMPFVINYLNDEYFWFLNGNHNPIAATFTFTAGTSTSQSSFYMTNVTSGVEEQNAVTSFNAFPNPANDQVNLQFTSSNSSVIHLHAYDLLGKEVRAALDLQVMPGENSFAYDVSDLEPGVYMLVTEENGVPSSSQRVIIAH